MFARPNLANLGHFQRQWLLAQERRRPDRVALWTQRSYFAWSLSVLGLLIGAAASWPVAEAWLPACTVVLAGSSWWGIACQLVVTRSLRDFYRSPGLAGLVLKAYLRGQAWYRPRAEAGAVLDILTAGAVLYLQYPLLAALILSELAVRATAYQWRWRYALAYLAGCKPWELEELEENELPVC